jgi:asparagine N-glycosylation enzyme membrane subunit Stt3
MLGEGGVSVPSPPGMPSMWRVLGTMVLLILLAVFGFDYLTRNMSKERAGTYFVLGSIWLLTLYLVLSLILGSEKRDRLITKVMDKLLGGTMRV